MTKRSGWCGPVVVQLWHVFIACCYTMAAVAIDAIMCYILIVWEPCCARACVREQQLEQQVILLRLHPPPCNCRRVDQFHLVKNIGSGYASSVYLASDKTTGNQVALKQYHKNKLSELNMFQVAREIKIHSILNHENILQLVSWGNGATVACMGARPCMAHMNVRGAHTMLHRACMHNASLCCAEHHAMCPGIIQMQLMYGCMPCGCRLCCL